VIERIREYTIADEAAVVDVWHRAGLAAYTYLPTWQSFTLEHARRVFREVIAATCQLWVATREDCVEHVVGYMAMKGSYLDRLYVDPAEQRRGVGARLLDHAKRLSPAGLELHTHQQNHAGRAFYERHGFVAVKFGISLLPESAPDVEYHWRISWTRV
jgi:ribosomal protein S18 acetylase RimI-like enzyme